LRPLLGVDAVICVPDNDRTRVVCAESAWSEGVLFAQGGCSATGGQTTVHGPGSACFSCVTGLKNRLDEQVIAAPGNSCAQARESVVSANMAVAALLVSELREGLSGRRTQNIRLVGSGPGGNRLVRMSSNPPCLHRREARTQADGRLTQR
ncbi:MAG: hypothetical protein JXB46_03740, partial [Candidatus Eisenbacteria bacterium]|nr:hypothetical protein [Candidatus Eisenbacteria bacterium]